MNIYQKIVAFLVCLPAGFVGGYSYRSSIAEKEQSDAEKTIKDLRSRIADGSLRLSVRTKDVVSGNPADGPSASRTELDTADAQEILDIASTGDSWRRQLNQCINQYNAVREKYNADTDNDTDNKD